MPYPVLRLKPKKEVSLSRRHPWIFSGALSGKPDGLAEGDKVYVADARGYILATGHYGTGSIAVRILDFEETLIDAAFYESKLTKARLLREVLGLPDADTTGYRLVHGEGDSLPGLIIDIYAEHAAVQCHSAGTERDFQLIEEALRRIFGSELRTITGKRADGEKTAVNHSEADAPERTEFREYGHRFFSDTAKGQKTGFFLDQRENRQLIKRYAKGRKVLNAFCYTGGFSVYALAAGAREVHSLDSSKRATELAADHVAENCSDTSRHRILTRDALKYLGSDSARDEAYDLLILDPPAFAKHRSARHAAIQAYKRLNAKAFSIAAPKSIVFTFSCSQVVTPELFYSTVAAAAMESGRHIRILHRLHQPADHPVSIYHPEGAYLKGLVVFVE